MAVAVLACARAGAAEEYRVIPVTSWSAGFLTQSEVDKLLGVPGVATSTGDIRNANCNAVLVEVRRRADVCYPSSMGEPYMSGLTPSDFNALQAMIDAAHDTTGGKKRIEVHCWIVVFRTADGPVHSQHNNPADPDNYWVTLDDTGVEPSDMAFDPGHPKAAEYTVNVCMDLVNNFDIDGIHFDYIRFTGPTQGYNPTSIARYNARYGTTGQPAAGDPRFQQWRRDQVTAVVRKVYAKVQASKPWVKVSGSFVGGAPSPVASTRAAFKNCRAYYEVYSDWDSWIQEGIVDFAAPMTYFDLTTRLTDYTNWINFHKDRKGNRLMVTDAGTYMNYLSDALTMLEMVRDPSPAGNHNNGFGAYSYQSPYSTVKSPRTYGSWSTWSAELLSRITPTWADIPQMSWKTSPTKGHIGGTVTYPPNGAWADGASVEITGPETRAMLCDGTGFYAFIDLTPGTYTITADYLAFETTRIVTVTAGAIADGDIALTGTDPTPPVATNVAVSNITDGSAVITWTTDDPATSQVEYDFVPGYGQSTPEDPSLLTAHSVTLSGLTPNTNYHFRVKSVNITGLVGCSGDYVFTTQPVSSTIIIDELDADCTFTGSWSVGGSGGGWGGGYKYAGCTNGTPTATATWTPTLPRTGPYDVSTYYREGSNRPTDARFTVNYATGSRQVNVDQTVGRQWIAIGSGLQFSAGRSGNVVMTNQTANTLPKSVIADAVRFEYKGDLTPPVMNSVTDDKYTVSTTALQASWSGSDSQSGIQSYKYAVGTAAGLADVKAWTDAGAATSATFSGLSLAVGHTYYVSVRAVNGASLTSAPMSSSGVTVARSVSSVVEAKGLADGEPVCFAASSVTVGFASKFYIEDSNRVSGIRVESTTSVSPNQMVQVFGTLGLADGCERAITNCKVIPGPAGPAIRPLEIVGRAAGGSAKGSTPGITGGVGLNNVGLLVRVAGNLTAVVSDGFYLDDGSGLTDETGNAGIKVWTGDPIPNAVGVRLGVTGVVSCRPAAGKVYPMILARDVNAF